MVASLFLHRRRRRRLLLRWQLNRMQLHLTGKVSTTPVFPSCPFLDFEYAIVWCLWCLDQHLTDLISRTAVLTWADFRGTSFRLHKMIASMA
jgi:hypothetical protein